MTALYFRKRPVIVQAVQLTRSRLVALPSGHMVHARPGDWLVTSPEGDQCPVADHVFRRTYEACEPAGVWP